MLDTDRAFVLFSGGQDSATCLAWALDTFSYVETVGIDYGQNHAVELVARQKVLGAVRQHYPQWDERLGPDHEVDLRGFGKIAESALTADQEIAFAETGLPTTFVPARNLIFFSAASALAYRRGLGRIVGGMCQTDYSGYPDCRRETVDAMERALTLGLDAAVTLDTPLMDLTKAQTWDLALQLGGPALVEIILEETHTCYRGERGVRHDWGYGCGTCPACELRARGWREHQEGRE